MDGCELRKRSTDLQEVQSKLSKPQRMSVREASHVQAVAGSKKGTRLFPKCRLRGSREAQTGLLDPQPALVREAGHGTAVASSREVTCRKTDFCALQTAVCPKRSLLKSPEAQSELLESQPV